MELLAPVLPRLALLLATFAQPFLVTQMLSFILSPRDSENKGWALVGAFLLVYGVCSVATGVYWETVCAIQLRLYSRG